MSELSSDDRSPVTFGGVPDTMLWPLWNRAGDAADPRPLLHDPMAVQLIQAIDGDLLDHFGKPNASHALWARFRDSLIRDFLMRHPAGPVIALGEGLDTQFWRVDNGTVEWISVDLPPAIDLRRRLLPAHPRCRLVAQSVPELRWLDDVSPGRPAFITAAGLMIYFEPDEVVRLLRSLVENFPGGEVFFDTIPPWLSRREKTSPASTKPGAALGTPCNPAPRRMSELLSKAPGLTILKTLTHADPYPDGIRFLAPASAIPRIKSPIAPGLIHAAISAT